VIRQRRQIGSCGLGLGRVILLTVMGEAALIGSSDRSSV
jgi:hypothetical protein